MHVHDLKRTFGRRLQAAAVYFSCRKVLLGHLLDDIIDHYSISEIAQLIKEANWVCSCQGERALTVRTSFRSSPRR